MEVEQKEPSKSSLLSAVLCCAALTCCKSASEQRALSFLQPSAQIPGLLENERMHWENDVTLDRSRCWQARRVLRPEGYGVEPTPIVLGETGTACTACYTDPEAPWRIATLSVFCSDGGGQCEYPVGADFDAYGIDINDCD